MSQNQTPSRLPSQQTADECIIQNYAEGLQHYFTKLAVFFLFSQLAGLMHSMFSYKQLC